MERNRYAIESSEFAERIESELCDHREGRGADRDVDLPRLHVEVDEVIPVTVVH